MKNWDMYKPEERYSVRVERGGTPIDGIELHRISDVYEELIRWHKANHIHSWFVHNVQNGSDNCAEYYVSEKNLRELRNVCQRVINGSKLVPGEAYAGQSWDSGKQEWVALRRPGLVIEDPSVAKALLPTRAGHFYGSQEYDEDYLDEVVRTCDWIRRTLENGHDDKWGLLGDIYYSSSW